VVLEEQLAFLQARDLELIGRWVGQKVLDSLIEKPVLRLESLKIRLRLIIVHRRGVYPIWAPVGNAARQTAGQRRSARAIRRMV
jgi:hypothetical protein